jgi:hypothetical protein
MKKIFAGLVVGLLACAYASSAFAFGAYMCAPDAAVNAQGPRSWYNINNTTSGLIGNVTNPYSINSFGCAYLYQADIPTAQSQGWTYGSQTGVINYLTGVQTGSTNLQLGTLPANTYIQAVIITNLTANATTATIVGSTSGGAQVVASVTIAASVVATMTLVAATGTVPFPTAPTAAPYTTPGGTLWIGAGTWNSANLAVTVIYSYF